MTLRCLYNKSFDNHSFFQGSFHRLFPINICTIPSDLQFNICISRLSLGWNWSKILGDFWAQWQDNPDPWKVQGWLHYQKSKSKRDVSLHLFLLLFISNFKTGLPSQEMSPFWMNFSLQKPSSAPDTFSTKLTGFKIKLAHFWPYFHILQAQRIFHMFEYDFKMACTHFSIREFYQKVTNYNLKHAKLCGITQKWTCGYF